MSKEALVCKNLDKSYKKTEVLKGLPGNIQEFVGMEEYKESAKTTIIENSKEIILKILSFFMML